MTRVWPRLGSELCDTCVAASVLNLSDKIVVFIMYIIARFLALLSVQPESPLS